MPCISASHTQHKLLMISQSTDHCRVKDVKRTYFLMDLFSGMVPSFPLLMLGLHSARIKLILTISQVLDGAM